MRAKPLRLYRTVSGLNINTVGVTLLIVGVIGFVNSLFFLIVEGARARGAPVLAHTSKEKVVQDPRRRPTMSGRMPRKSSSATISIGTSPGRARQTDRPLDAFGHAHFLPGAEHMWCRRFSSPCRA
jgi:hypothetical protein